MVSVGIFGRGGGETIILWWPVFVSYADEHRWPTSKIEELGGITTSVEKSRFEITKSRWYVFEFTFWERCVNLWMFISIWKDQLIVSMNILVFCNYYLYCFNSYYTNRPTFFFLIYCILLLRKGGQPSFTSLFQSSWA